MQVIKLINIAPTKPPIRRERRLKHRIKPAVPMSVALTASTLFEASDLVLPPGPFYPLVAVASISRQKFGSVQDQAGFMTAHEEDSRSAVSLFIRILAVLIGTGAV